MMPSNKYSVPLVLKVPKLYKAWLIEHCRYLDLKNLMDKGKAIRAKLPEIFVPLYTDPLDRENDGDPKEQKKGLVNIEGLVENNDYLLIEGQAGSGKTTLQKHIAYTLVNKANQEDSNECLPILIFLKDLQHYLKDSEIPVASIATAEKFLAAYLGDNGLDWDLVEEFCKAGRTVFLIDGLDEIEPCLRELIVNSLADYRNKFDRCKIVLTGRPHGVDDTVVNRFGERHIKIKPLNWEQVKTFIVKWFEHIYDQDSRIGKKTAIEMIGDMCDHQYIKELITNPLMLTANCILYFDGRRLPEQKSELYQKFIDNLLHRRFDDPEKVGDFLETLAFKVHRTGKRGFDHTTAVETMQEIYSKKGDENSGEYRQRLRTKFDEIEQDCGLLTFNKGEYDFWHLTFQEFLTARWIVNHKSDYGNAISEYWNKDWYREVIKLYIGYLGIRNKGWANKIVEDELKKENQSPFHRWRLACQSLLDMHQDSRNETVVKLVQQRLLNDIVPQETDPKIKAEASEILSWLGNPRWDNGGLKEFVNIEGGEYTIKPENEKEPSTTVTLAPFEIGKYPVTNRWYQEFVETGGYDKENLWTPEGFKWKEKEKVTHPAYWHDRKWKCPNAPVVGASWYEADAFCRWLTENVDDGYIYRLLTEEEWQAAAAGKKGREYPWGEWIDDLCNYDKSEIGKTSPVGIFVKANTPEGVTDLSGNVWEWTDSWYDKDGDVKTIRGGSWGSPQDGVRCACRLFSYSYFRDYIIGFRCFRTKKNHPLALLSS